MKYNFKVSLPSVVEYGANFIERYNHVEYIKLIYKKLF